MKIGKEDLGPSMSRLVQERMATLMTERATAAVKDARQEADPFATPAFVASFIASGDVPTVAKEALQWARGACNAMRLAAGGFQGDDETIASVLLNMLDERKHK